MYYDLTFSQLCKKAMSKSVGNSLSDEELKELQQILSGTDESGQKLPNYDFEQFIKPKLYDAMKSGGYGNCFEVILLTAIRRQRGDFPDLGDMIIESPAFDICIQKDPVFIMDLFECAMKNGESGRETIEKIFAHPEAKEAIIKTNNNAVRRGFPNFSKTIIEYIEKDYAKPAIYYILHDKPFFTALELGKEPSPRMTKAEADFIRTYTDGFHTPPNKRKAYAIPPLSSDPTQNHHLPYNVTNNKVTDLSNKTIRYKVTVNAGDDYGNNAHQFNNPTTTSIGNVLTGAAIGYVAVDAISDAMSVDDERDNGRED